MSHVAPSKSEFRGASTNAAPAKGPLMLSRVFVDDHRKDTVPVKGLRFGSGINSHRKDAVSAKGLRFTFGPDSIDDYQEDAEPTEEGPSEQDVAVAYADLLSVLNRLQPPVTSSVLQELERVIQEICALHQDISALSRKIDEDFGRVDESIASKTIGPILSIPK